MNKFGIALTQNRINQKKFRKLELEFLNNPTTENNQKAHKFLNEVHKPHQENLYQIGKELIVKRINQKKLPQSTIKTNVNHFINNLTEFKTSFPMCDYVLYSDLTILFENCHTSQEFIECMYALRDAILKADKKNRYVSLDTKDEIDSQIEYYGKDDIDSIYLLENFKPLYGGIMFSIGEKFWVK